MRMHKPQQRGHTMPQDIEVRVEQLGEAIAEDPEAFQFLLAGVAQAMQEDQHTPRHLHAEDVSKLANNVDTFIAYAG